MASCRYLITAVIALLLSACASDGDLWDPTDYTVKSGDTLYSVAWRYELDPDQFAAWNGLSINSRLKAGDRVHTRKPSGHVAAARSRDADIAYAGGERGDGWIRAEKGDTLYAISRSTGVTVDELVRLNDLQEPYTILPGQIIHTRSSSAPARSTAGSAADDRAPVTTTSKAVPKTQDGAAWPKTVSWRKPATGKIVKRFKRGAADAKGIDIAGKQGAPILAAAGGQVVYSGDGLISYGNLIIIKHNRQFLSAYAYNQKLLVKEGEKVNAGQRIALMGSKDKSGPMLHFEIRKNGKPVDPLKYLPW